MYTTEELLQSVLIAAANNIKNNIEGMDLDLDDIVDIAHQYTDQYASCIPRSGDAFSEQGSNGVFTGREPGVFRRYRIKGSIGQGFFFA